MRAGDTRATRRRAKAAALPARRRFTADEYERMIAAGILREGERVELIEGEIVQMAAMGSRHSGCLSFAGRWFITRLGDRATVKIQSPIRLQSGSEPEPDLTVLRPRTDDYRRANPGPEDVLLLVEIADSSLAYDLNTKLPVYAEAGILEVWVVDLPGNRVHSRRDPMARTYRTAVTLTRGDTLSPIALPELRLPVNDLLG